MAGDPTSSNNGIFYLFTDHLGSTVVLTKDSDGYIRGDSLVRYNPFGGYRGDLGTQDLTDRGFTGHKENMDIGLIYINARFYVPTLNRFASADTIVPDPANPQSFNRYSYVENRPMTMVDPSGHNGCTFGYLDCDSDDGIDANGFPATNSDEVNEELVEAGQDAGVAALVVAAAAPVAVCTVATGGYCAGAVSLLARAVGVGGAAVTTASAADGDPSPVGEINAITQAVTADGNPINELEAVRTGVNTVYQSVQNGVTRYVGITNNFARRAAEHARTGRTIERIPGLNQLSRYDAKAVEQWLIESYGLPRNGGILENIYNSIAPANPIYPEAIQRGLEILTKTGNLPQ